MIIFPYFVILILIMKKNAQKISKEAILRLIKAGVSVGKSM